MDSTQIEKASLFYLFLRMALDASETLRISLPASTTAILYAQRESPKPWVMVYGLRLSSPMIIGLAEIAQIACKRGG